MIGKFLSAAALIVVAGPAVAAVTVVGNSAAQSCYQAAAATVLLRDDIGVCDRALNEEALTPYEEVATLVNRGILKLRDGRTDSAIADFDAAIARDPDQSPPGTARSRSCRALRSSGTETRPLNEEWVLADARVGERLPPPRAARPRL
mgnify:CR=1 FL=1